MKRDDSSALRVVAKKQGPDQSSTRVTGLSIHAARLYPGNEYLQREWIRAVAVVRSTKNGWQCDKRVQRVAP